MRIISNIALSAALTASLVACTDYPGPVAEPGSIYWPIGLTLHPSGDVLYVMNSNFDGEFRDDRGGSIVALDADTLMPIEGASVEVGSFGAHMTFVPRGDDGSGRLYAAVRGDDSLVALDVGPGGQQIGCREAGELGTAASRNGLPCALDVVGRDPFDVVAVPETSGWVTDDIAPDDLLVVSNLGRQLALVGVRENEATGVRRGDSAIGAGFVGTNALLYFEPTGQVLAAARRTNAVSVLDWYLDEVGEPADILVSQAAPLPTTTELTEMRSFAATPDFKTVYLAISNPDSVVVLDARVTDEGRARLQATDQFDLDGDPSAMHIAREPDGDRLYVALRLNDEVAVVSAETGEVEARIAVGEAPYDMAYDESRQRLLVSLFEEGAIIAIDLDPASPTFRNVIRTSKRQ
ncbi:MAG: YVTN family beta-propeller protein [Bradymonadia bacterium]|jgi:YVTN family beta-propeller protein